MHADYQQAVITYNNRICRFVDKLLLDNEAAKDITQEVYLKLWENREKINFEKVKPWLFTTAYRLTVDFAKRRKKYVADDFIPEKTTEQSPVDLKQIVHKSLDLLSDIQRTIVLLRDYEGYSYAEIGEILQLQESQVKVYLFRARQKIKEYIGDIKLIL